ncbi:hypothetical protein R3W88_011592 [Solanum pinnatisectum]|uniref:RNase H type-1 domain-containing protein n=1 Tax=Solanum pinnatisectum TaxID=50273 RepID=A0AAV9L6X6_9SOLN|nr:hypothetical protein R3W88_011592 [Solanum pinnatisectum]
MEYQLLVAQKERCKHQQATIIVKWKPPHRETYKLNIDRAAISNPGASGIGGIFRDHVGHWILGFSESTPKTNHVMVELQALQRGLQIGVEHKLTPFTINIDSSHIIN